MINVLLQGYPYKLFDLDINKEKVSQISFPLIKAASILKDYGVNLFTLKDEFLVKPDLVIYWDFKRKKIPKYKNLPSILMRLEPPTIKSRQWEKSINNIFDLIGSFNSWNIEPQKFFKVGYPHDLSNINYFKSKNYSEKIIDFSMITRNKIPKYYKNQLISLINARQEIVKFFEKNKKYQFNLYGDGWGIGMLKPTKYNFYLSYTLQKIFSSQLNKETRYSPKNYCGILKDKVLTIKKSKFVFSLENTIVDGYLTEKIVDTFKYGAIPIYQGDPIFIDKFKNNKIFINPQEFENLEELVNYCLNISKDEYIERLMNAQYLLTSMNYIYSSEKFAKKIFQAIDKII